MRRELLEDSEVRRNLCRQYPVEYEFTRHPFSSSEISDAVGYAVDTGINDDTVCWLGYDWCGNPVGVADKEFIPFPTIIPNAGERITIQRSGNEWIYLVGTLDEIYEYHKTNV